MNKHQAIALLVVVATGCTTPHSFVAKVDGGGAQQPSMPLSRMQPVAQLQVDAASVYSGMIEYYVNPAETTGVGEAPATMQILSRYLDAIFAFKPGSTALLPAYSDNQIKLERFNRELTALMDESGGGLKSLCIRGYASPDGHTIHNGELAYGRARSFADYLNRQQGIPHQKILIDTCQEDWEGLKRIVTETGKPYAAGVVAILEQSSDPEARRKALKALDKGRVWKEMEQTLFARLRRMELDIICEWQEPVPPAETDAAYQDSANLSRLLVLFNTQPERLSLDELLAIAPVFRPGTEQFREVYEQAAYRFPDCIAAQLNAGAAALAAGDTEAARFFLERVAEEPCARINLGVLALMEHDPAGAADWFWKALPAKPLQARTNLQLLKMMEASRQGDH